MRVLPAVVTALAALTTLPGTAAGATLPAATLRAPQTTVRPCHTGPIAGAGVVHRSARAWVDGTITIRLDGGTGDWDVAAFDARGGRVAAASTRAATERALGTVRAADRLTVQACRRPGASASVRLSTSAAPLARRAGGPLRLVRVATPTRGARRTLDSLGLDLTEGAGPGFRVAVIQDIDGRALRRAGLTYRVLVSDLAAADRAARRSEQRLRRTALPSGRTSYRRLADYSAEMKALAAAHPGLVRPVTLAPASLEGRAIEGVEVATGVGASDGRPVFLQLGLHHAREWPSGEVVMEFAQELVARAKAGEPRVTGLLQKARVVLVPVVNPDGFELSREAPIDLGTTLVDLSMAYKRKNCRLAVGQVPAPGACGQLGNKDLGTDLNRNYGMFWGGPGADPAPSVETFRGGGPFSEPETEAVRRLISSRQVVTLITNHTFGSLVLRPPGFSAEGDAPDEAVLAALGAEMAAANGYANQKGHELYDTAGTTEDWSYYATGGLGYTFEIGGVVDGPPLLATSFHPAYPTGVVAEYESAGGGGNREAYLRALESTANPARHAVITGLGVPGRTLRLMKAFNSYTMLDEGGSFGAVAFPDRLETTMTVPAAGRFEWHVNPSTRPYRRRAREIPLSSGLLKLPAGQEAWTLTCESGGAVLGTRSVVVDRGQKVDAGAVCGGATAAFTFAVSKRKLRTALAEGLRARARCSARCKVTVRATVTAARARALGLSRGRKAVVVARSALKSTFRGRRAFTLRFTRKARAALRNRGRVALRITATAGAGTVTKTVKRSVTLRR